MTACNACCCVCHSYLLVSHRVTSRCNRYTPLTVLVPSLPGEKRRAAAAAQLTDAVNSESESQTAASSRSEDMSANTTTTLKLYTSPASRGRIVEWYLKELGVEAQLLNIDIRDKRDHRGEEFLKANPFGKVPTLVDGDFTLFETGAILTYLAEKYGKLDTPETRAKASQWVIFANSTLANSALVEQYREKSMPDVFGALDKILADREYLEGGEFSVADVAVGSYLLFIPNFFPQVDLSPYPNVIKYMDRLAARPACAATVAAARPVQQQPAQAACSAGAKE